MERHISTLCDLPGIAILPGCRKKINLSAFDDLFESQAEAFAQAWKETSALAFFGEITPRLVAFRDVAIAVKHSELERRNDLVFRIDEFVNLAEKTWRTLLLLEVKTLGALDSLVNYDIHMLRRIKDARAEATPELREEFLYVMKRTEEEIEKLQKVAEEGNMGLEGLKTRLDVINTLVLLEMRENDRDWMKVLTASQAPGGSDALAALWKALAAGVKIDEKKLLQNYDILQRLAGEHVRAVNNVQNTIFILENLKVNLGQVRDQAAETKHIIEKESVDKMLADMRNKIIRLKAIGQEKDKIAEKFDKGAKYKCHNLVCPKESED